MESAQPSQHRRATARVRRLALATLTTLVLALGGLLAWQTSSGLENVDRMMRERSAALHSAAAREVRDVVRFGTGRRERLDGVLRAIATDSAVVGILLERRDGGLRLVHGTVPPNAARARSDSGRLVGTTLLVAGPLRIETAGCNVETGTNQDGCGTCGSTCPAAGDRALDGEYQLIVAFAVKPFLVLRRSVYWQGAAGGLLLAVLALALWLFARQMWKAGEMRSALALADARTRYLERLTMVAGGLAHEIKNPLSSLRGFAQLIGEAASPESTVEYAGLMVAELDAINRRVDGLRHFARPSLPELQPCRPAEVVRRVTALLGPDATARQVRLEIELPAGADLDTIGDEERLRELVGNLAINAIEASPPGGTVRVSLRVDKVANGAQSPERFALEVSDEGPGIPPEDREVVLRPFHSSKPNGMGLGLALAQRAVEDHGGLIEIGTASEGGALLRASWPRRKP